MTNSIMIIKPLISMKRIATIFFLSFIALSLWGQQPAQYSLYMLNKFNWNPAYAGLDNSLSMTGVYRDQWTGLDGLPGGGSPQSANLSIHAPVYFLGGGMGLNVENDAFGPEKWTSATLAYNYQLNLNSGNVLSLGFSGGVIQREIDGAKLRTPEGNYLDNVFDHNDPILPIGLETAVVPTFNAGVYYQSEAFEAGLSVRHLTEASAEFSTLRLSLVRNYFLMLGGNFEVGRSFSVHPSILVQSDVTQTQVDFSTLIRYNENVFAGASLRGYNPNSLDAVAIIFGFKLSEKLTLGYAYDLTLSNLNTVSNGSHEIALNYNLNTIIGKGRPPKIIYNPRSL